MFKRLIGWITSIVIWFNEIMVYVIGMAISLFVLLCGVLLACWPFLLLCAIVKVLFFM